MGTDLEGRIEVQRKEGGPWVAVGEELGHVLPRSYDLYGCLFGVRNYAGFAPLFGGRGVPEDASTETTDLVNPATAHDASWATYEELRAIDPKERALAPDQRIHEFVVAEDGTETMVSKSEYSAAAAPHYEQIKRDGEVRVGNMIYRAVTLTRGDALNRVPQYATLLDTMATLAREVGPRRVRIVVGFDS